LLKGTWAIAQEAFKTTVKANDRTQRSSNRKINFEGKINFNGGGRGRPPHTGNCVDLMHPRQ